MLLQAAASEPRPFFLLTETQTHNRGQFIIKGLMNLWAYELTKTLGMKNNVLFVRGVGEVRQIINVCLFSFFTLSVYTGALFHSTFDHPFSPWKTCEKFKFIFKIQTFTLC